MTTPLFRARVLYLGCAVPKSTKEGLQAIQDPLQEIYPDGGADDVTGIDGFISVWSNGILVEYPDSAGIVVSRFHPIETLHYCAGVRYVPVSSTTASSPRSELVTTRFFPLDSPHAHSSNHHHPPLFTFIIRRTAGIKVLECHAFICKNADTANALVRACFHSYSDSMQIKLYDYVPQPIPVIIPKTKSVFKLGTTKRSSRSRSVGPASSRSSSSVIMTPSPTPYIYDVATPTKRSSLSSSVTPRTRSVVPAPDYRYASNQHPQAVDQHFYNRSRRSDSQPRVWSGSSHNLSMDNFSVLSNNPNTNRRREPVPTSAYPYNNRITHSRLSQHTNDSGEYADVASIQQRYRSNASRADSLRQRAFTPDLDEFDSSRKDSLTNGREVLYESTTVERKKGNRMAPTPDNKYLIDEEFVEYHKEPNPRRSSSFQARTVYDSQPDVPKDIVRVNNEVVHPIQLERAMRRLDLRGSNGSTGSSTPNSSPTESASGFSGEERRQSKRELPHIPPADYQF